MGETNSNFRCEKCGQTGEHRRLNDQYAGELWQCRFCGWKTIRDESRSWAKVTPEYAGSQAEKDYEADVRDANFREVLDYFTLRYCTHFPSGRFSAAEQSRIGAILLRHWERSDEVIVVEMKAAGFDLSGTISPPAQQVARMRALCEQKYSEKLRRRRRAGSEISQVVGKAPRPWWKFWG